ncbi:MAG: hypothetical protein GY839_21315 [candidate division Zixibacteria bacterium]|nr:hypothetical protein [candidate division Zixibacteria bacterium]
MITSRTIVIISIVGFALFGAQMLTFTQSWDNSKTREAEEFAKRDVGLSDAERQNLIDSGESNLGLEEAASRAGFKDNSPMRGLYKHQETRKIIAGSWIVKKQSGRSNIYKARFDGKKYYLYAKNGSGDDELIESGRHQTHSEFIMLNPSAGNASPKMVQLIDRRYFVLEAIYDGYMIEFEKIS